MSSSAVFEESKDLKEDTQNCLYELYKSSAHYASVECTALEECLLGSSRFSIRNHYTLSNNTAY